MEALRFTSCAWDRKVVPRTTTRGYACTWRCVSDAVARKCKMPICIGVKSTPSGNHSSVLCKCGGRRSTWRRCDRPAVTFLCVWFAEETSPQWLILRVLMCVHSQQIDQCVHFLYIRWKIPCMWCVINVNQLTYMCKLCKWAGVCI